jgi:tetratricopeptide (TPR) repeat protein
MPTILIWASIRRRGRVRRLAVFAKFTLVGSIAIVLTVLGSGPLFAGDITLTFSRPPLPAEAIEFDAASRGVLEIGKAIKSFQKNDFEACIAQLTKARTAHPELPPPQALFARLAFLTNQGALIRPALERAVADDPVHPEIYILFGNLALIEGRLTDSALHFDKAEVLASAQQWSGAQRRRFERLCHQGCAQVAEGRRDWKAARAALEAWLKQEPANAAARYRLGRALFGLGEHRAAFEELQHATKTDATLEPAAITMGWLFTRAGDVTKAGEWMNYAVKIDAESLDVQMGVAAWLVEQNRGDEAQSHIEALARIDAQSNQVRKLSGLAARQRKDLAQAELIFQAMVNDSPADAWARNQLALVLAEQNDPARRQRAVELAELSVRQNPKATDSLATLGTVYYRLGRLDDAEKLLQTIVGSGQGSSDAAFILAQVHTDRGQTGSVVPLLKMAINAQGMFISRRDAQQWLNRLTVAAR